MTTHTPTFSGTITYTLPNTSIDLAAELTRLQAVNAELVSCLAKCLGCMDWDAEGEEGKIIEQARAAIERATNGGK